MSVPRLGSVLQVARNICLQLRGQKCTQYLQHLQGDELLIFQRC
jgi:hypothetical protein